jgi:hypothetical protein
MRNAKRLFAAYYYKNKKGGSTGPPFLFMYFAGILWEQLHHTF